MKITIKIKRQKSLSDKPYYETFNVDADETMSISYVLNKINSSPITSDNKNTTPIEWECSCNQKMCGACAMLINSKPSLACATLVRDTGAEITLEPLTKFPLIADLRVDRSCMYEHLKNMNMYIKGAATLSANNNELLYESSRCLMCGCCLEICINYTSGGNFFGATAMNSAYKAITLEVERNDRNDEMREIIKHGINGCSKSLSCENICPAKIPLGSTISALHSKLWKYYFHKL